MTKWKLWLGWKLPSKIFVLNDQGQLLRTVSLPSPGVPNLALSQGERTLFVTGVDQLDRRPYQGKLYAIANE